MTENPITGLLGIMQQQGRKDNPTVCLTGTVTSVTPLLVQAGGIELDSDDVLVNASLLPGYQREVDFDGTVCEVAGATGTAELTDAGLHVGDTVLLIPAMSGQQYYLICALGAM